MHFMSKWRKTIRLWLFLSFLEPEIEESYNNLSLLKKEEYGIRELIICLVNLIYGISLIIVKSELEKPNMDSFYSFVYTSIIVSSILIILYFSKKCQTLFKNKLNIFSFYSLVNYCNFSIILFLTLCFFQYRIENLESIIFMTNFKLLLKVLYAYLFIESFCGTLICNIILLIFELAIFVSIHKFKASSPIIYSPLIELVTISSLSYLKVKTKKDFFSKIYYLTKTLLESQRKEKEVIENQNFAILNIDRFFKIKYFNKFFLTFITEEEEKFFVQSPIDDLNTSLMKIFKISNLSFKCDGDDEKKIDSKQQTNLIKNIIDKFFKKLCNINKDLKKEYNALYEYLLAEDQKQRPIDLNKIKLLVREKNNFSSNIKKNEKCETIIEMNTTEIPLIKSSLHENIFLNNEVEIKNRSFNEAQSEKISILLGLIDLNKQTSNNEENSNLNFVEDLYILKLGFFKNDDIQIIIEKDSNYVNKLILKSQKFFKENYLNKIFKILNFLIKLNSKILNLIPEEKKDNFNCARRMSNFYESSKNIKLDSSLGHSLLENLAISEIPKDNNMINECLSRMKFSLELLNNIVNTIRSYLCEEKLQINMYTSFRSLEKVNKAFNIKELISNILCHLQIQLEVDFDCTLDIGDTLPDNLELEQEILMPFLYFLLLFINSASSGTSIQLTTSYTQSDTTDEINFEIRKKMNFHNNEILEKLEIFKDKKSDEKNLGKNDSSLRSSSIELNPKKFGKVDLYEVCYPHIKRQYGQNFESDFYLIMIKVLSTKLGATFEIGNSKTGVLKLNAKIKLTRSSGKTTNYPQKILPTTIDCEDISFKRRVSEVRPRRPTSIMTKKIKRRNTFSESKIKNLHNTQINNISSPQITKRTLLNQEELQFNYLEYIQRDNSVRSFVKDSVTIGKNLTVKLNNSINDNSARKFSDGESKNTDGKIPNIVISGPNSAETPRIEFSNRRFSSRMVKSAENNLGLTTIAENENEIISRNNTVASSKITFANSYKNSTQFEKENKFNILICQEDICPKLESDLIKVNNKYGLNFKIFHSTSSINCLQFIHQLYQEKKYIDVLFIQEDLPFITGSQLTFLLKKMKENFNFKNIFIVSYLKGRVQHESSEEKSEGRQAADSVFFDDFDYKDVENIFQNILK